MKTLRLFTYVACLFFLGFCGCETPSDPPLDLSEVQGDEGALEALKRYEIYLAKLTATEIETTNGADLLQRMDNEGNVYYELIIPNSNPNARISVPKPPVVTFYCKCRSGYAGGCVSTHNGPAHCSGTCEKTKNGKTYVINCGYYAVSNGGGGIFIP